MKPMPCQFGIEVSKSWEKLIWVKKFGLNSNNVLCQLDKLKHTSTGWSTAAGYFDMYNESWTSALDYTGTWHCVTIVKKAKRQLNTCTYTDAYYYWLISMWLYV